jgi:hypothetical protein
MYIYYCIFKLTLYIHLPCRIRCHGPPISAGRGGTTMYTTPPGLYVKKIFSEFFRCPLGGTCRGAGNPRPPNSAIIAFHALEAASVLAEIGAVGREIESR